MPLRYGLSRSANEIWVDFPGTLRDMQRAYIRSYKSFPGHSLCCPHWHKPVTPPNNQPLGLAMPHSLRRQDITVSVPVTAKSMSLPTCRDVLSPQCCQQHIGNHVIKDFTQLCHLSLQSCSQVSGTQPISQLRKVRLEVVSNGPKVLRMVKPANPVCAVFNPGCTFKLPKEKFLHIWTWIPPSDSRKLDVGGRWWWVVSLMCSVGEKPWPLCVHIFFSAQPHLWLPMHSHTQFVSWVLVAANVKATGDSQHLCCLFLWIESSPSERKSTGGNCRHQEGRNTFTVFLNIFCANCKCSSLFFKNVLSPP